jgi:hypothetical protein
VAFARAASRRTCKQRGNHNSKLLSSRQSLSLKVTSQNMPGRQAPWLQQICTVPPDSRRYLLCRSSRRRHVELDSTLHAKQASSVTLQTCTVPSGQPQEQGQHHLQRIPPHTHTPSQRSHHSQPASRTCMRLRLRALASATFLMGRASMAASRAFSSATSSLLTCSSNRQQQQQQRCRR